MHRAAFASELERRYIRCSIIEQEHIFYGISISLSLSNPKRYFESDNLYLPVKDAG